MIEETVSDIYGLIGMAIGAGSGIVIAIINGKIGKNKNVKARKICELKNHDIFSTLKRITYEVANMKFYTDKNFDRVKTSMCYDFTSHKAKYCAESMIEIIEIKGIDQMGRDKLKALIVQYQMDMHKTYIAAIRKYWLSKDIQEDDIDYVVRLFDSFRYDVINSFDHRITSIFGASYHKDNFSIMLAVFEMWAMGIDLLPRDMQTTFESLNGKFKNLNYRKIAPN